MRIARALAALAGAALFVSLGACDPLPVDDQAPRVTSLGPIVGQGEVVVVHFSVFDAEGDSVELDASWCRDGELCAGGTCTPMTAVVGGTNPWWVATVADAASSHEMRWRPGCDLPVAKPDEVLTVCLAPLGGESLQSAPFRLMDLGVVVEDVACTP